MAMQESLAAVCNLWSINQKQPTAVCSTRVFFPKTKPLEIILPVTNSAQAEILSAPAYARLAA